MRLCTKLISLALLSLSLSSCSLSFPVDILLKDGRIVFASDREWKWFIIPHRPPAPLCEIRVYDSTDYVWRLRRSGERCAENGIPIAYGDNRPGLETVVPAKPLIPGRVYAVEVVSWAHSWPHLFKAPAPGDEELQGVPEDFVRFDSPEERRVQELRSFGVPDNQIGPKMRAEEDAQVRMSAAATPAPADNNPTTR